MLFLLLVLDINFLHDQVFRDFVDITLNRNPDAGVYESCL